MLTNKIILLEKFPGKGGWTYARIPLEIAIESKAFGMVRVHGKIDETEFKGKHLMPHGDGSVFLPISKSIRKEIGKEAGDTVRLSIFLDSSPTEIPEELKACLEDIPSGLESFQKLSDASQKQWIEYIFTSKNADIQASRIIQLIDHLTPKT
ncbi:YdeI/OmpD-associated family protein [Algoriphagus pacificus]|uniref:DUF1905 domain-containing protein n=1 Tax=Algoriphagus pacificus TaxID=2811234 RepID=A0ABS3CB36_9BACT|nr:YdeI/OmpD-associated family protein [Algoriphagus pacificus]MBN7814317.1 DUF1905 domain-containing protein [Algoriphagus pacificus]